MITDEIVFANLPTDNEAAFIELEKQASNLYQLHAIEDEENYDSDDRYYGTNEPKRAYVSCILGALEEFEIEIDLQDISELPNAQIDERFPIFKARVARYTFQLSLRKLRGTGSETNSVTYLSLTHKVEISELLSSIRKIVIQEIDDANKKERILHLIALLQSEVDRDRTTLDTIFSRMIELSEVLGKVGDKIEPLINKLERLKKLFWESKIEDKLIEQDETPKQITYDENTDNE